MKPEKLIDPFLRGKNGSRKTSYVDRGDKKPFKEDESSVKWKDLMSLYLINKIKPKVFF